MRHSGKRSPCPSCGRDSDGDCRFSDQVVLCHAGKRFAPPRHLRVGDVITLQGRPWALVATGKGYDGAAHVFKPHRENSRHRPRPQKRAVQVLDLHGLEQDLSGFDLLARQALEIPPLEQMLDADISQARDRAAAAQKLTKELIARITRLQRSEPSLEFVLEQLESTKRALEFQLKDLELYLESPCTYWEKFLLNKPSEVPSAPAEEIRDWEFWNTPDPNYRPKNPAMAAMYSAWRANR